MPADVAELFRSSQVDLESVSPSYASNQSLSIESLRQL